MENLRINELANYQNKEIISNFLVAQKELREGTKDFYLRLKLVDKTGSIVANIWNNAKRIADLFNEGDVVKIQAMVISYKSQLQLTISKIKVADELEYDLSDFVATTKKDITKLADVFFGFIDNMKDENIKMLMKNIFEDKEFFAKFSKSPAAKTWHHNYVGGLLEHSVSVAKICNFVSDMYPVDKDLLIAGALLHDVGKVYEYNFKTMIEFTTMGRLVGHLCIGDQIISETASKMNNFPQNTLIKLRHLILSHHGEYEKAAARLPQTLEAIVLHMADNLDAQSVGVTQLIEGVQGTNAEWTEYDKLNNRYFYIG